MKVCDLTQFYSPVSGGVKRYLGEKRRFIGRSGGRHQHVLVVPGERSAREDGECGRCYTIGSPLLSRSSRYRALLNLHAVEEILEAERPDVIESGDPYQMAWKALASGRGLGIPVVAFYHSHFPEAYLRTTLKYFGRAATEFALDLSRRYILALYSRFAATMVPSRALAELLGQWGVPRLRPLDLGVDCGVFRPEPDDAAATRRRLGIPDGRILLLYVGRLALEKNTRTLFAAFRELAARRPPRYHLLVVGDGNQRHHLERLEADTGCVTRLAYCGDPGELAAIYRAADVFVHPGVLETFGLVALEAQACGTPVVGIKGSYMDRIIFSDQSHWAAENSPAALAAAVARLARRDPSSEGQAISRQVHSKFSWDAVFGRQFALYDEIVDGFGGRRRAG